MMRIVAFIIASYFYWITDTTAQKSDTIAPLLPLKSFWQRVKEVHPVAKQAQLFTQFGQAELLASKGGFDPKLYGDYEQKYFDRKNYFGIGEYGVKVPTWYGVELKGSYNTTQGVFLNPEDKLPSGGQAVVGISFPLLQGLMIDERRANLFKARQGVGFNQAEREAVLNDLAIDAARIYWKWAFYNQQLRIYEQALDVASLRFTAIKTSYELGERTGMDTLESFIQVQDRQFQYNEALIEYQNALTELNVFLSAGRNVQPVADSRPEPLEVPPLSISMSQRDILRQNIVQTHPALRAYGFKLSQLDIDQRLKREKLKPKLNLNYNFLGNGFQLNNVFTDNYKWGVSFSTSTLFRAERGDVQLAKLKIENTQMMLEQKVLDLNNKLQQYFNENDNLLTQIDLYIATIDNYQKLLQMENTRFELGESSLFLINSREMKVIEARVKLAKLYSSLQINRAAVDWTTGTLADKLN